jgi:Kef-type K+ transport system membrane component KefB
MEDTAQIHLLLSLLLSTGLLLGLAASRVGLPRVAAYVLAGILFSPGLLGGPLGLEVGPWTEPMTSLALAIIAYLIGGSLTVGHLRRTGRVILGATLGETLGACVVVFVAVLVVAPPQLAGIPAATLAVALAGMAATTAPAATVAVLHQYQARGPVSDTLLGVVALDDALGVVLFAVVLTVATGASPAAGLATAAAELALSAGLGAATGQGLGLLARHVRQGGLRLPMVLAALLLVSGIAERFGLSPLLAAMATGFTARHALGAAGDRVHGPVEYFEELVFLIFFTVAGAHFDPRVFSGHWDLIAAYLLARVGGKVAGAALGARLSGAPPAVVRWLGLGLVPQAGVAVGLALTLSHHPRFQGASEVIVNVILATTVLYEVVGPLLVRHALQRAGELGPRRGGAGG